MHPRSTVEAALVLVSTGLEPTEVGRRLGVPKSTVQYWCRGGRRPRVPGQGHPCPRCDDAPLDEVRYAYLLGSYLGDGHITAGSRHVPALAIYCADDWPGVRQEVEQALRAVMPSCRTSLAARTGCHAVLSYSIHWLCLFPQHGPGRKHERSIVLEPWQQALVERHPGPLLRGLFHSDGCRIVNWTRKRTAAGPKRYEYPRYLFSNKSEDILGMCEAALDLVDVAHRRPRWDMVSVARRAAVARLDEFVGPKY